MKKHLKSLFIYSIPLFLFAGCKAQNQNAEETDNTEKMVNAPEINTKYGWLNTNKAYSIKDFKGKIVLLDFWTFGCINCQHIIPDLKKLEKEYPNELVVIGVHSAKFDAEKSSQTIRKAILKFGIEHPVVNDADYVVWTQYAVKAWPTVVLINPKGKVVGQQSGEGVYEVIKPYMERLIKEFAGEIDRKPIAFQLEKNKDKKSVLRFPSKMIADAEGNVWFSDSGNNRIIQINKEGKILQVIGNSKEGLEDGDFAKATFYEPQGLALLGDKLYIADTKNNAIRLADLTNKTLKTIAGDGKTEYYYLDQKWDVNVKPNSPWDLLIEGEEMYIAGAGNHQILKMNLKNNEIRRFAGSGREALTDGKLKEAAFNQPSGLTKNGNILYVADSEASAIRAIDLATGLVTTPLGKGLFDFGDKDGDVEKALLQHCVGIKQKDGKIYIADTYNGKIKILDLQKQKLSTLIAGLDEPNDIIFIENEMWVSDTNNHQLIKINLTSADRKVIEVR